MYAFAIRSMVHCGSAFEQGASRLPHYCTPPVRVPAVIRGLAVWRQNKTKKAQDGWEASKGQASSGSGPHSDFEINDIGLN